MRSIDDRRALFVMISESYRNIVGLDLVSPALSAAEGAEWLYSAAPFAVLAHDTAADPVFIYANKNAQDRFGYDWNEFVELPSRLSAEADAREARDEILARVRTQGYVQNYSGVRVKKFGERFLIRDVTIWQIKDSKGTLRGQAALFP